MTWVRALVLCDDIRFELGGTMTLVGVLADRIVVGAQDDGLILPRLGIYTQIAGLAGTTEFAWWLTLSAIGGPTARTVVESHDAAVRAHSRDRVARAYERHVVARDPEVRARPIEPAPTRSSDSALPALPAPRLARGTSAPQTSTAAPAFDLTSASLRDAARPGNAGTFDLTSASLRDAARPGNAGTFDRAVPDPSSEVWQVFVRSATRADVSAENCDAPSLASGDPSTSLGEPRRPFEGIARDLARADDDVHERVTARHDAVDDVDNIVDIHIDDAGASDEPVTAQRGALADDASAESLHVETQHGTSEDVFALDDHDATARDATTDDDSDAPFAGGVEAHDANADDHRLVHIASPVALPGPGRYRLTLELEVAGERRRVAHDFAIEAG